MAVPVASVRQRLAMADEAELLRIIEEYSGDERRGVQAIIRSAEKKLAAAKAEALRTEALWAFEKEGLSLGFSRIAGVDEVGRGPLAGPVVAAAVILPADCRIAGINDSKKLSEKRREQLFDEIGQAAAAVGYGMVSPERIDEINILRATLEAMHTAVSSIAPLPDYILVDGRDTPETGIRSKSIIGGDGKSISIAAASIMAKVTRDRIMRRMDEIYPEYSFASNKGYGSREHVDAILAHGLSPIHRRSFVRNIIEAGADIGLDTRQKGDFGERAAEKQMLKMGYVILERNFRGTHSEIDIIAEKDGVVVFTEVKLRKSARSGLPSEAVGSIKQRRIIHAAKEYAAQNGLDGRDLRFDVAELLYIDGKLHFKYTENAFWES